MSFGSDWIADKFGKAIQRLREQRGLSRIDLAERAGLSEHEIAQIEAGALKATTDKVHADKVERLVTAFGRSARVSVGLLEQMEDFINWEESLTATADALIATITPLPHNPQGPTTSASKICLRGLSHPRPDIECRGCSQLHFQCWWINA